MTNQDLPDADSHQSDQENSRHHETTERDAPPAHESHGPGLTSTPAAPESPSAPKDSKKDQAGKVTSTFTEFGNGQGLGGMVLSMVPSPGVPDYQLGSWAALIQVKCHDIARLMREGFNWSAENVLPEEGCKFHATDAKWSALGFRYARRWIIVDRPYDYQDRQ